MTQFLTPVGRLVQGHPMKPITTDMHGKPLTNRDDSPRTEFFAAIALPKTDPETMALIQNIQNVAAQEFPQGQSQQPGFSWKIIDGDASGNENKPGFAGCYVLRMTNGYAPQVVNNAQPPAQITNPEEIKRGYFIRAYIDVTGNGQIGPNQTPGIYVNLSLVQFVAYGEEIASGPDAAAVFGAAPLPAALPAGATAAPQAPAPVAAPGSPAGAAPITTTPPPTAGAAPSVPPAAAAVPQAAPQPGVPVQPHPGFLQQ